jgi:type I restriction enzyme S subunit
VPEHWEVKRLKFLCSITTGSKDTVDAVEDGIYPFFVRSQTVERINTYSYDGEAVLTAGDGAGVGKIFHYFNGKFDFHQRVYLFYSFSNVCAMYIYYCLLSNFYNVALDGSAKSTVDSLRLPLIQNFNISFPSHDEQLKILNYLDQETARIDELIQLTEQSISLIKERRSALITAAVTGKIDVREQTKQKDFVA